MKKFLLLYAALFWSIFFTTSIIISASEEKTPSIILRSTYKELSNADVLAWQKSMHEKYKDKLDGNRIINHNYQVDIIDDDKVVIDNTTGLMWHQSGSEAATTWQDAEKWVNNLNTHGYAGYTDWRFPTLEEAASLLKSEAGDNGLYIDSLFNKKQKYIWTGDSYAAPDRWYIDFDEGKVLWSSKWIYGFNRNLRINYVRPVRTGGK